MRFEQTREILLHQAAEYHRSVSKVYQEFAEGKSSTRNRLMLDYLIDHELRLALAIQDFVANAADSAVEQWFRHIEMPFPPAEASILTSECRTDLDTLVGAAIRFKAALINFYGYLLQQCDAKETADLFSSLKNQEEKSMKRLIRHAQGLADL